MLTGLYSDRKAESDCHRHVLVSIAALLVSAATAGTKGDTAQKVTEHLPIMCGCKVIVNRVQNAQVLVEVQRLYCT